MKRISKIQTFDGALHNTQKDAERHLAKLYADALCKAATKLVAIEKYGAMCDFLNDNLDILDLAQQIKADMAMLNDSEED